VFFIEGKSLGERLTITKSYSNSQFRNKNNEKVLLEKIRGVINYKIKLSFN